MKKKRLLRQAPEVVKRYVRIRSSMLGRSLARRAMRHILTWKERRRRRVLRSTLRTIAFEAARSKRHDFMISSQVILNTSLFLLIAEQDIQTVKIDALTHPDPWQRKLAARIILLTIHEFDLDKAAGGRFRQALVDAGVSEEMKSKATIALRAVRKAQEKAKREFSALRNMTIAHRDADALLQYRAIMSIDESDIFKIGMGFYSSIQNFISLLPQITIEVGGIRGILNQMTAHSKQHAERSQKT